MNPRTHRRPLRSFNLPAIIRNVAGLVWRVGRDASREPLQQWHSAARAAAVRAAWRAAHLMLLVAVMADPQADRRREKDPPWSRPLLSGAAMILASALLAVSVFKEPARLEQLRAELWQ